MPEITSENNRNYIDEIHVNANQYDIRDSYGRNLSVKLDELKANRTEALGSVGYDESGKVIYTDNVKNNGRKNILTISDLKRELQLDNVSNRSDADRTAEINTIVDTAKRDVINTIIGGNPSQSYDTLKEISDWLENHPNTVAELNTKINGKSDKGHTHTTSDITNFPTTLPANGGNADTVGGYHIQPAAWGNSIPVRDQNGCLEAPHFIQTSPVENNTNIKYVYYDNGDGVLRKMSVDLVAAKLGYGKCTIASVDLFKVFWGKLFGDTSVFDDPDKMIALQLPVDEFTCSYGEKGYITFVYGASFVGYVPEFTNLHPTYYTNNKKFGPLFIESQTREGKEIDPKITHIVSNFNTDNKLYLPVIGCSSNFGIYYTDKPGIYKYYYNYYNTIDINGSGHIINGTEGSEYTEYPVLWWSDDEAVVTKTFKSINSYGSSGGNVFIPIETVSFSKSLLYNKNNYKPGSAIILLGCNDSTTFTLAKSIKKVSFDKYTNKDYLRDVNNWDLTITNGAKIFKPLDDIQIVSPIIAKDFDLTLVNVNTIENHGYVSETLVNDSISDNVIQFQGYKDLIDYQNGKISYMCLFTNEDKKMYLQTSSSTSTTAFRSFDSKFIISDRKIEFVCSNFANGNNHFHVAFNENIETRDFVYVVV